MDYKELSEKLYKIEKWDDLKSLDKEELLEAISQYDDYIIDFNSDEDEPAGFLDYVTGEFAVYCEDMAQSQADYELTDYWNDKERQKSDQYHTLNGVC